MLHKKGVLTSEPKNGYVAKTICGRVLAPNTLREQNTLSEGFFLGYVYLCAWTLREYIRKYDINI